MRMGKPPKKKSRRRSITLPPNKPKHSSPGLVVGQVSSNLIDSIYAPTILNVCNELLEQYASDVLDYQDLIKEYKENNNEEQQTEVDMDGTVTELPPPPVRPLCFSQAVASDLKLTLGEVSKHFSSTKTTENGSPWKVHANAAKFERQLDEKYGVFKPFITEHPEIENALRQIQRKYAMGSFSPFRQTEPPLSKTTSIILLFMLQRNGVKWEALVLAALFLLVGLQPWALVALVALGYSQLSKRKQATVGTMKSTIAPVQPYYSSDNKMELLKTPVGSKLSEAEVLDGTKYDTLVLGTGPATLYTSALLARAGRKVLVLSNSDDASGCLTMIHNNKNNKNKIPFDVGATNVARLGRMQQLLAPALCTTTDLQGGIRFVQVGSQADGHAFEILSIPGMGSSGGEVGGGEPFVLRSAGGMASLMEDTATFLGDGWAGSDGDIGHSTAGIYLAACAAINASSSDYYLGKVLPEGASLLKSSGSSGGVYQDMAVRYASNLLDRYFSLNAHVRSLMAGIGMKGESLKPSKTSIAPHVTNICASLSAEGIHYPIGGPRALSHALATVVEQSGGRVVTGVQVKELVFLQDEENGNENKKKESKAEEGEKTKKELKAPRCIGVKLASGQSVTLPYESTDSAAAASPAIVSMEGFINTFIRLLPESVRSKHKVPRGLPALTESRPVFKVLFALKGSAQDLNVTGADFYRLPEAALARDEMDPDTGEVKLGVIGGPDDDDDDNEEEAGVTHRDKTAKEKVEGDTATTEGVVFPKKKKSKRVKFDSGASWIHISFPSAKDPSFATCHGDNVSTCVVTIEADDDFCTLFETKPRLYALHKEKAIDSGERSRLLDRVKKDLLDTYPQLEGKIDHSEVCGPFYRGLSHNPERYAAKGVRAESPYPGLFVGGSDLTVGESFAGSIVGGWLAANAVMGYSMVDHLYLEKNITSDLERFLDVPYLDEEDLAVPFAPKEPEQTEVQQDATKES